MKRVLTGSAAILAAIVLVGAYWLWTPDRPRAQLEREYMTPPSTYIRVAGLRLHVRDSGPKTAPALIFLHGFGSSLQTWEPWANILAPHYRLIRFDLPGFGLTGADPTGDYGDARALTVLRALMDRLGIARATVIGNSLGGRIAWQFAAADPARVDRLVLISPDGFASPGFEYGRKPDVGPMVEAMRYVLPKAFLRANLVAAYGNPAALNDALLQRYYDMMLAPGARGAMIERLRQTIITPPEAVLRRIRAPTLILWGTKDALIPVTNAADYHRNIAGSTLGELPGLGHVPQEEAPAVSIRPLEAFLAR
jgi:pimeloyl-ACP methyl ester carboxylesterase